MRRNLKEFLVISFISVVGVSYYIFHPGVFGLLLWFIKGVLILGVSSFLLAVVRKLYNYVWSSSEFPDVTLTEAQARKIQTVRHKKQDDFASQAKDYQERILKPREERKQKKIEESLYRFSGPAWKGQGHVLQSEDGGGELKQRDRKSGTSRTAAEDRKLPTVAMPTQQTDKAAACPAPKPVPKKIVLPDEPEAGEGVITIAFRTPQGRPLKRRFHTSGSIQVVLDYITVMGFSDRLYTVCTSYPRTSLSHTADSSLHDLGLTRDCVLNVEEKD